MQDTKTKQNKTKQKQKQKSAMKNKHHETIPESSSEQEPNGISFGLNELYGKYSYTLYVDWNKYVLRRFLNALIETKLQMSMEKEFRSLGAHEEKALSPYEEKKFLVFFHTTLAVYYPYLFLLGKFSWPKHHCWRHWLQSCAEDSLTEAMPHVVIDWNEFYLPVTTTALVLPPMCRSRSSCIYRRYFLLHYWLLVDVTSPTDWNII